MDRFPALSTALWVILRAVILLAVLVAVLVGRGVLYSLFGPE